MYLEKQAFNAVDSEQTGVKPKKSCFLEQNVFWSKKFLTCAFKGHMYHPYTHILHIPGFALSTPNTISLAPLARQQISPIFN